MSESSSSVTGHPAEDARRRTCLCGLPVREYTSKKTPSRGLRFICCPKKIEEQCTFFEWIDNGVSMRSLYVSSLEDKIRDNQATIAALEARIVDLLVSERLLQLSVQQHERKFAELQAKFGACDEQVGAAEVRLLGVQRRLKYAYFLVSILLFVVLSLIICEGDFSLPSKSSSFMLGP